MDFDVQPLAVIESARIRAHFESVIDLPERDVFDEEETQCRKSMRAFLKGHPRYNTANGWNASTSYAHCIKVHGIPFPADVKESDSLYTMMGMPQWQDAMSDLIRDFDAHHDHCWQVGGNGRSGGYLVVYKGYIEADTFTNTICSCCGIRTGYTGGECRKGGCDGELIAVTAPKKIGCWPGKSTDMGEDFGTDDWRDDDNDWDTTALIDRCEMVQSFDRLCSNIAIEYASWVRAFHVETKQVMRPVDVEVLVAND